MEEAEREIRRVLSVLIEEYGIPLYATERTGAKAFEWPADPDAVAPEEMAMLVQLHGEQAVREWITQHYMTRMQQQEVDETQEIDIRPSRNR